MGAVAVLHPENRHFFPKIMRSRRSNPNFTNPPSQTPHFILPDSRRRPPPKGILKNNNQNTDSSASAAMPASKKLVMRQVKMLKRGEEVNESLTVLKEVNNRKVSNDSASTSEASKAPIGSRRVLSKNKKKVEAVLSTKVEASKPEEVVLSSTHRLGPDPEIASKEMKNITECFAGSVFSDSPPPSSVPLPGFFRNNGKDDDATTDLRRILGLSLC